VGQPARELRRLWGRRLAMVFQDPTSTLNPVLTVGDQLVEVLVEHERLRRAEARARMLDLFAAVQLPNPAQLARRYPHQLSGGQQQRVSIATALACDPDLLVLDEPTTGLDFPEQQKMMELLRRLHAEGRTIVIITHTPWVIAEYTRHVVLLADGRVRYDGGLRAFFEDDELLAAAAFRAPEVTRLGRLLGCTPLSVEELLSWVPRRSAACP
jgi:peptide/nickel transport system ATP-binding protein